MSNTETRDRDDAPEMEILSPLKGGDLSPMVAAEINQQVATARRFPRRRDKDIADEIMGRSTFDEETATECLYNVPRSDKEIIGPSIRFAEIVMAAYGNLRVGSRFVEIDTRDPKRAAVLIEGMCLDLQANVAVLYPIRRSIVTRKGGVFGADMTNVAFLAGSAIARREAVLKCVPKVIWRPAFQRVLKVVMGDAATIATRRAQVLAAFDRLKVERARLFALLEVKDENDITIEHMPRLVGILNAIKEGTETVDSVFNASAVQDFEQVKPLSDKEEAAESTTKTATKAEPTADTRTVSEKKAAAAEGTLAAAEAKPAAPAVPAKMSEYATYATAWIAAGEAAPGVVATKAIQLKDRWTSERKMRNDIAGRDRPLNEDEFTALTGALNVAVAKIDATR